MRAINKGIYVVLIIGLLIVLITAGSGFLELLGTRRTEMDVESGRVRSRVLVFGAVVSDRETETRFSRAVARCNLQAEPADYQFAGSESVGPQVFFGTLFVCSEYGQAIADVDIMMRLFELRPALRENECEIIAELMKLLRLGNVDGIRDFVYDLHAQELEAAETELTDGP